ncbi:MAG: DNA-processing protein DprA [Clostridia bacterium]|nr:DNA-processing protein DprA [Clostridia bacterium]
MEHKLYWIWLALKESIPLRVRLELYNAFGDIKTLYETTWYDVSMKLPPEIEDELMDKSLDEAEKIYNKIKDMGGYILVLDDEKYPGYLAAIPQPPLVLYCRGKHIDWKSAFCLTVVGTRDYCDYGRKATEEIVKGLTRYGAVIVSGMARGIDAIAGCAALHEGGDTVAVLGSGLDVVYPPEYGKLYNYITKHGVVMTEFPPGTSPLKQNFPRRNRIMSGLSLGILVGQAPEKSGALISAKYATEDGRNVYVVPSDIYDKRFAGSNALIKDGAKLVRCAEDIIEDYSYLDLQKREARKRPKKAPVDVSGLSGDEKKIVELLSGGRLHIDELVRGAGVSSGEMNTSLMMLEINGIVKKFSGNMYGLE